MSKFIVCMLPSMPCTSATCLSYHIICMLYQISFCYVAFHTCYVSIYVCQLNSTIHGIEILCQTAPSMGSSNKLMQAMV